MPKKKVTLSIESKVYSEFQKYCDENAIMLSKKIELFMKNASKSKKFFLLFMFSAIVLSISVYALQFLDSTQSDFNNGTYVNSSHNGTGVVLSGNNLSATFTSKIFDATSLAAWTNVNFYKNAQIKEYLFSVDITSDVWRSNNSGVNWTLIKDDYNGASANGATTSFIDNSDNFFIIFGQQIWRSLDYGVSWTKIVDDYNGIEGQNAAVAVVDKNNSIYILEGDQDVWKSTNSGVNWSKVALDFNGGNGNFGGVVVDSLNRLIAVDIQADVWRSNNSGVNWTLIKDDYNGGIGNNVDGVGIDGNDSVYVYDGASIWKSSDYGSSWSNINTDFNGASDTHTGKAIGIGLNNTIFMTDSNEDVFISNDSGINFSRQTTDFNSGNSNVVSVSSFSRNTSVTLQIRNCSSSCTNENYFGSSGTNTSYYLNTSNGINITGRYFQYKVQLTSQEAGFSPTLLNVSVNYTLLDTTPPFVSILSPLNSSYSNSTILINISSNDSSGISSVWFFNGSRNESYTVPVYRTFSQGSNSIIAYANDSIGNLNSTSIVFYIDSISPVVSILSPTNNTYLNGNIFINYSISDGSALSSCWYSIDGSLNITLTGCSTASLSLSDGAHQLRIYANDSIGNLNSSSVYFGIDSTPPQWSAISEGVVSSYSPSQKSYFNITWSDANNISSVLFESNFSGIVRNYTMQNLGNGVYGFNTTLPAGTFYWKSYANDSTSNLNSSSVRNISIIKAENNVSIYLNGNLNQNLDINYGTSVNASAIVNSSLTLTLYRNGIAVSNPDVNVLGVGSYNYSATVLGNENYTLSTNSFIVNVSKATPSISLLVNGIPSDLNEIYGTQTNVSAQESNQNDNDVDYTLYRNDAVVNAQDANVLGVGSYNYTYISSGGENYTTSSVTRNVVIEKYNVTVHLYLNGDENNINITYGNESNVHAGSDSILAITLYRNGIAVSNPDVNVLGVGSYNYSATVLGNENYTGMSIERMLNVEKATPSATLLLNGVESDLSYSIGGILNVTGILTNPSGESFNLYENEIFNLSGNSAEIIVGYTTLGDRTWTLAFLGNENYTSKNITHIAGVRDPNAPQYSNLKSSNGNYAPGKIYQLNVTWSDNVGIDNVILEFNNVNYSFNNGSIQKNNDEYYAEISNLAVGNYNYKWYANDTSGNNEKTGLQSYSVDKAITALFMTMSPSNSLSYGTISSITCSANNLESSTSLTRNIISVTNPDINVLGVGSYNYACTASSTQNYTSSSTTGTLSVVKANPIINLTINGFESNLTLPTSGGIANISANLVSPNEGELNLTINSIFAQNGQNEIENESLFNSVGIYEITVYFAGNQNYTSGSVSKYITVEAPFVSPSGGGGGGGGGGGSVINQSEKKIELDFLNLDEVLISPGESKTIQISMKNSGQAFLNKCRLIGSNEWFESNEIKNINVGEISDFILKIKAPLEVKNSDNAKISLECLEKTIEIPLKIIVLKSGLNLEIISMNLISKNELEINYTTQGNSEFSQTLVFSVIDSENNLVKEKESNVYIKKEKSYEGIILDVSKANKGLLKIAVSKKEDGSNIVEEFFVYDSSAFGVTGFAFFDKTNSSTTLAVFIVLAFSVVAYFMVRRIMTIKKWEKVAIQSQHQPNKNYSPFETYS